MPETALPLFYTMTALGFGLALITLYQMRKHTPSVRLLSAINEFNKYVKIGLLFLPVAFFSDAVNAGLLNYTPDPWAFIALVFGFFTWFRGFYVVLTSSLQTAQYKAERDELEARGVDADK